MPSLESFFKNGKREKKKKTIKTFSGVLFLASKYWGLETLAGIIIL